MIVVFNSISLLFLFSTLIILLIRKWKESYNSFSKLFFSLSYFLLVLVSFTNLLEHQNITNYFDAYEDFLEVLFIPFFVFALFSITVEKELLARMKAEKFSKNIIDTIPAVTYIFDIPNKKLNFLSKFSYESTLEDNAELLKNQHKHLLKLFSKREIIRFIKHYNNIEKWNTKSNEFKAFEFQLTDNAGIIRYYQSYETIFNRDKNDKPNEIVGVAVDITDKKLAQQEIENYKNHLEKLVKERTEKLETANIELLAMNDELNKSNDNLLQIHEEREKQKVQINKLNAELLNKNAELITSNNELQESKEEIETTLNKLHSMQDQLVQSEKLSALGTLIAGIAHEINNPINFINSGVNVIQKSTSEFTNFVKDMEEHAKSKGDSAVLPNDNIKEGLKNMNIVYKHIREGVNRIMNIINSLNLYSRTGNEEYQAANLNEITDSVLVMLYHEYKNRINIHKNFKKDLPMVLCMPEKIDRVIMNLTINSIHAIKLKGDIYIKTDIDKKDNAVIFSIEDTGVGVSDELKEKIFDPFFTTKEVGKGTGLGLSICYEIIKNHAGKIWVENKNNTRFNFSLPLNNKALSVTK